MPNVVKTALHLQHPEAKCFCNVKLGHQNAGEGVIGLYIMVGKRRYVAKDEVNKVG